MPGRDSSHQSPPPSLTAPLLFLLPFPHSGLTRLEVTCCRASQAGLDGLAAALPRLARAELCLQDGVSGDRLLPHTAVGEGGGLTAHASRAKANSLVGAAGQHMPGVGRLAVRHTGCGFLLTAPPTFHQLRRLTALRCLLVVRVQLACWGRQEGGGCSCRKQWSGQSVCSSPSASRRRPSSLPHPARPCHPSLPQPAPHPAAPRSRPPAGGLHAAAGAGGGAGERGGCNRPCGHCHFEFTILLSRRNLRHRLLLLSPAVSDAAHQYAREPPCSH